MHHVRQSVTAGEKIRGDSPLVEKRSQDRGARGSLVRVAIKRLERRQAHQRNEDRYHVTEIDGYASWRGMSTRIKVANLSSNGLMIVSNRDVDIGEMVAVRFADCNPVNCEARWVRDGRIGLEFAEETEIITDAGVQDLLIEKISDALGGSYTLSGRRIGKERRGRAARHGLVWVGRLTVRGEDFPVRLRNISTTGAMLALETDSEPFTGQRAVLDLGEAGRAEGLVKWASGSEVGLQFSEPFELGALANHPAAHVDPIRLAYGRVGEDDEEDYESGYHFRERANTSHLPPEMEYNRLTLDEVYATLYPDGKVPQTSENSGHMG